MLLANSLGMVAIFLEYGMLWGEVERGMYCHHFFSEMGWCCSGEPVINNFSGTSLIETQMEQKKVLVLVR